MTDTLKTTPDTLREAAALCARERAAAIAHYVYMKTAARAGWDRRVPTLWEQLPPEARDFNMASIDTWANEPDLFKAWLDAVQEVREGR